MQIAINIPKEFERDWNETRFADCIQRVMCDLRDYPNHDKMTGNYEMETLEMLQNAFENGKQLPKGHGKLKDIDKIINDGISKGFCEWYDEMKYAETIIEADKE